MKDITPHYVQSSLKQLKDQKLLVREASQKLDAVRNGGGYLYSVLPAGRKFPTLSGRYLIENGLVSPRGDGLIENIAQTFELPKKRRK